MKALKMNGLNHGISAKSFRGNWKCLIAIIVVYGLQELLRLHFFKCPCVDYWRYSLVMLAAPSVFLLGLGFCWSDNYWKIVRIRRNISNYKLRLNCCLKSLPSLFEPLVPVASFIVMVLLKGEYYACAMHGTHECVSRDKKQSRIGTSKSTDEIHKFYNQSQLLGCGLLAGVSIFATGIVFIRVYFFERDSVPDFEEYCHLENEMLSMAFREKLQESISNEVKRDVEEVFDGLQDRPAEMIFRQARDRIQCKKNVNKVGRFQRLTPNEDGDDPSERILDSHL